MMPAIACAAPNRKSGLTATAVPVPAASAPISASENTSPRWRGRRGDAVLGPPLASSKAASTGEGADASVVLRGDLPWDGEMRAIEGRGNGPIDAFTQALSKATGHTVRVMDYHQHAIGAGADVYLASDDLFLAVGGGPEATAHAQRITDTAMRGFLERSLAP